MKTNYAFLIVLLTLSSCTKLDDDNHLEGKSVDNQVFIDNILKNNKISQETAKKVILTYIEKVEKQTRDAFLVDVVDDGKIVYSVPTKTRGAASSDSIGVYKFIVKSGEMQGYGLVADDIRIPGVIAYCPEGSLNDTVYNEGLAAYMRDLPNAIVNKIARVSSELSNYRNMEKVMTRSPYWGSENPPTDFESFPMPEYDGTYISGDTVNIYENSRLIAGMPQIISFRVPVKWGQSYPYNKDVPYSCGSDKAPAGCVAIAIAQIMAYHKYPSKYNWDLLTQTPTISGYSDNDEIRRNEVARLIADIGREVNMVYSCSGSGSNIYKANDAFSKLGYSTSGVRDYYYIGTCFWPSAYEGSNWYETTSFDSPFYVRGTNAHGEGHAFVIDELFESYPCCYYKHTRYIKGVKTIEEERGFPLQMFFTTVDIHINWGWNGSSNGYFKILSDIDFVQDRKIIFQIHPK